MPSAHRSATRAAMLAASCGVALSVPRTAAAQDAIGLRPQPEVRADLIAGRQPAAQMGVGVQLPLGYYVRIGIVGAAGVRLDDVSPRADARVDLLARFLLDPFRQSRYGLSVGGGLGLRTEPGDRVRPVLLVAADLEGRRSARGITPALQVGLGGGVRVGLVLRRQGPGAR
jgi:hypothetical protein